MNVPISGSGGRSELDTTRRLVAQMPTSDMDQERKLFSVLHLQDALLLVEGLCDSIPFL